MSPQNHGLQTKQPEKRHGENAPEQDIDGLAADIDFAEVDGEIELLETCKQ